MSSSIASHLPAHSLLNAQTHMTYVPGNQAPISWGNVQKYQFSDPQTRSYDPSWPPDGFSHSQAYRGEPIRHSRPNQQNSYGPYGVQGKTIAPDYRMPPTKPAWSFQQGLRGMGRELMSPRGWLSSLGWGTLFALGSALLPPHVHGFFVWLPCVMVAAAWRLMSAFVSPFKK